MKKLYWGVFIIVAVGAAAGLLYLINKPTPAVAPVVVKPVAKPNSVSITSGTSSSTVALSIPTSDLETYTNDNFGYTFQYPNYVYLKNNLKYSLNIPNQVIFQSTKQELYLSTGVAPSVPGDDYAENGYQIVIQTDNGSDLNAWLSSNDPNEQSGDQNDLIPAMIGGSGGFQYIVPDAGGYTASVVSDGKNIYSIYLSDACADQDSQCDAQAAAAYNKIVSTFQLTQPQTSTTSAAGWQTYTDSTFGFSFQYPSGWNVQQVSGGNESTWQIHVGGPSTDPNDLEGIELSDWLNDQTAPVSCQNNPDVETTTCEAAQNQNNISFLKTIDCQDIIDDAYGCTLQAEISTGKYILNIIPDLPPIYSTTTDFSDFDSENPSTINAFNQILSTFKFTN